MADNPKDIEISNVEIQFKADGKGIAAALVRTAMDISKQSLGAGTIPEWIKALGLKTPKEKQAFKLIALALIEACRKQLESRMDFIREDLLTQNNRELRYDIFNRLDDGNYIFNCNYLSNPRALPLLSEFKPYYKEWLIDSFYLSDDLAELLTADYPTYFATAFYKELKSNANNYTDLINWCNDPLTEEWARDIARNQYQQDIKAKYQMPALGQENISLPEIYTEPSFKVYDRILSEEQRKKIKKEQGLSANQHFLPINFDGNIHDYLLQHFLMQQQSQAINKKTEKERLLILLGQPGHGKSSFCYRSIHDILQKSDFNGNPYFIRLQDMGENGINTPMAEIASLLPEDIDFEDWKDPKYGQKTVLFLDGLDELYMTKSLSDQQIVTFINNCKNLLYKHKQLYIIITSRFNYVETSKLYNEDCLIFSLGVLSKKQQKDMVVKYAAKNQNISCNLDEEILKKCYEDHKYTFLKELIELPILLQMILISGIRIEDTSTKAAIYDELFDTILKRKWDKSERLKKYQAENNFQPKHLRQYISLIAYKIYQNNKGYIHKSEVEALEETKEFKQRRLRIEEDEDNLRPILKDILTSFYLKESRKTEQNSEDSHNQYAIEFLHKSLYEYLTCEYIWREIKRFFLAKDEDEYKRHSTLEVLKKVQDIFGSIRLSPELMEYLREIIDLDTAKHEDLDEQMTQYVPKLLQYGFLYEFKQPEKNKKPRFTADQMTANCFFGFWVVYGQLKQYKLANLNLPKWPLESAVKAEILQKNKKNEILQAFQEYTKQQIEAVKSNYWVFDQKAAINQLEMEVKASKEWFDKGKAEIFERWLVRFIVKDKIAKIFDLRIKRLNPYKKALAQFLILTGGQNLNLRLHFFSFDFHKIQLNRTKLSKVNFSSADLSNADLSNAYLSNAYLSNADLRNADLRNADLRNADLRNADLRNADFSNAVLSNAYLSNAYLRNAVLSNAVLSNAVLSNAVLSNAVLSNAVLRNAVLSNAVLRNAVLSNAVLSNAVLRNADLRNAFFLNADLRKADLSNAVLRNTDLRKAVLRNAVLRKADLRKADLSGIRVDQGDWLLRLSKWQCVGADEIQEKHTISKKMKTFQNRYGEKYQAYKILLKSEIDGEDR
jgi:uncharacterized protein YjbI with pentapeptide repeats/GTPase SAR1 family protein